MSPPDPTRTSAWPHRMAMLLTCATFPLIWLGGLVTTYDAGMAVPDWPSTYGYNLFLYPWQTWRAEPWDLLIEHGHRLLASLVGLIAIAAVVVTWRLESRSWVKVVALGALTLVIFQGVLGGIRVLLADRQMAQFHGIVGPVCFAYTVFFAATTSRWWQDPSRSPHEIPNYITSTAWFAAGLALFQLLCGSQVRHVTGMTSHAVFDLAIQIHIVGAVILLAVAPVLSLSILCNQEARRLLGIAGAALGALVLIQILLGITTWFAKYGVPAALTSVLPRSTRTLQAESMMASILATAHVANGALVLATSTLVAIRSSRYAAIDRAKTSSKLLTGAAG